MMESKHGNLPLPINLEKVEAAEQPDNKFTTPSHTEILPRTSQEVSQDLYDDQGIISKNLLSERNDRSSKKTLEDIMPRSQIEANKASGLPPSFSPILPPDPRNRQTEGTGKSKSYKHKSPHK